MSKFRHIKLFALRIFDEPRILFQDVRKALSNGNAQFEVKRIKQKHVIQNASNSDCLFVWIPKSAGTSVFDAFQQNGAQKLISIEDIRSYFKEKGMVTFGHIYIPALIEAGLLNKSFVSKAYKFTIVRNPFDRVVSLFEYLKRTKWLPQTTTFDIFCSYIEQRAWEEIGLINHDGLSQLNPQAKWITDKSKHVFVDKIYRIEDLATCWPDIWRSAGMLNTPLVLPQLNRSERKSVDQYFSVKTVKIVQNVYAEDFELLGYSKEPNFLLNEN